MVAFLLEVEISLIGAVACFEESSYSFRVLTSLVFAPVEALVLTRRSAEPSESFSRSRGRMGSR